MIRDRLKKVARNIAIKAFNMEFDTEDRDPAARGRPDPKKFDPDKIPKVVQGSGDTPGPKHPEDIGRSWVSAQLSGGVPPVFIDVRPPAEVVAGMLPGATLIPGELIRTHLDLLPEDKGIRVTVYDQTGEGGSNELATWLREQGWTLARRLQGGYAEWIEHDERIVIPEPPTGGKRKVGDPVRTKDKKDGWVWRVEGKRCWVWFADGSEAGPLDGDALK